MRIISETSAKPCTARDDLGGWPGQRKTYLGCPILAQLGWGSSDSCYTTVGLNVGKEMCTMTTPGYSAEASLYQTSRSYSATGSLDSPVGPVQPAYSSCRQVCGGDPDC